MNNIVDYSGQPWHKYWNIMVNKDNPKDGTFSLSKQLHLITWQTLRVVGIPMLLTWGIVSTYSVRQLIEERKNTFLSVVESHQEAIASGPYRVFKEGAGRGPNRPFELSKICWDEDSCETFRQNTYSWLERFFSYEVEAPVTGGQNVIARVFAQISFLPSVILSIFVLLALSITALMGLFAIRRHTSRTNVVINSLSQAILKSIEVGPEASTKEAAALPSEIRPMAHALAVSINELQNVRATQRMNDAIAKLATQVAHDIRSPLAAFESIIATLKNFPEEERIIIRGANNRIRDIANNLIERTRKLNTASEINRAGSVEQVEATEPNTIQLLSSLIDPLVTEKRMQYRSRIGIEIDACIDASSYGLFAKVQVSVFHRVLSNLINNGVEALESHGSVTVRLSSADDQIQVAIQDTGKGISADILGKLGERGVTFKQTGMGLGLYHARTAVQEWGGKLEIQSEVGKGTTLIISLPKAHAPKWFVAELRIPKNSVVVVLDDDTSVHQVWQRRFDGMQIQRDGIQIVHHSTPSELRSWVAANTEAANKAVYLTDYELIGFKETGLDLVEELKIGSRSILVSSRFEEPQIIEGCARLNVRLIPKTLAAFVPIVAISDLVRSLDLILIDDDSSMRNSWALVAKTLGKRIEVFADINSFFAQASEFDKSTAIYIDSNLSDGVKGEDVAKEIFEMGFKTIYLATGDAPGSFPKMDWITKIVDKKFPFS